MKVLEIGKNTYRVELSDREQAKVDLSAEQCNITKAEALEAVIDDGFECYDTPN